MVSWWFLLYPSYGGRSIVLPCGRHGRGKLRNLVIPDGPQIKEYLPFPDPGDHARRPPAKPLFQDRFRNPRVRNGDAGGRK
jgi:hypothetical protein